jgi:hypothetical protein
MTPHGTYSTYKNHLCRCALCTAANAAWQQGYRLRTGRTVSAIDAPAIVTWDDEFAAAWEAHVAPRYAELEAS